MKTARCHHLIAMLSLVASIAVADETSPVPADGIQFDRDVRPILAENCFRCHGPDRPKSDFRLDDRDTALKGGNNNPDDIVPGRSNRSQLISYVDGTSQDIQMPPAGRGAPLSPEQVAVLRAWIDQGAAWGTNPAPVINWEITPTAGWTAVSGDKAKFRELENIHEGPAGGLGYFSMTDQIAPDEKLSVDGHALAGQDDFKLQLALTRNDMGFIHTGYEQWRKYYDDTGGFYPGFSPPTFSLGQDPHLDIGRAWLEFGLTLPDTPRLVIGYEYQFREGSKSTLAWGTVLQGTTPKNIYPDLENLNEHTHIFHVDISREGDDWSVENHVRVEVYRLTDSRNDTSLFTTGPKPDAIQRVDQTIHYTLGADTFRIEKQINDWWLASAGVLLSSYEGSSLLNMASVDGTGAPILGYDWRTEGITLKRVSKVASLASSFLPVTGLSLSFAAQGDWTHEDGFGNVDLDVGVPSVPGFTPFPGTVSASQDQTEFSEDFDLHYSGLPRTILFAEGRARQQSVGQSDEADNATPDAVQQRTDAINHYYDARVGFTESPWAPVEWGGHVRRRESLTSYDHLLDNTPNSPINGDGYPNFIRSRNITTDEAEARLSLRPTRWMNARLTYDWDRSDFSSITDPANAGVPGGVSPGGSVSDGRTESHYAALNLGFTPLQRFYFSGSVTYGHSKTATLGAAAPEVVPYRGDFYTIGSTIAYVLNNKTDLNAAYNFSRADYGQNNTAGIPLGLDYTRHELTTGVKRQLTKNLAGALRYQFSKYQDAGTGHANDFTAHGIFASIAYRWP